MLSSDSPFQWFDDFAGVAYRYYDLRMNLVPLFHDFKRARIFWLETIKWWKGLGEELEVDIETIADKAENS